jgi:DNA replication protein DnaC
MAGPLAAASASSEPTPMLGAFQRFLQEQRQPRRESADLLAERAAIFALECRKLREASGVPARYAKLDLRDRPAWMPEKWQKLADILLEIIDAPLLLAIGGERGTGKTGLGCALVNAFCGLRRPGMYRRAFDFFDEMSAASWTDKSAVRAAYRRPDVLVLDEVQVRDADRQWQDNELTTLIDGRYADEKATVLLSNLTPDALEANVGMSVWRRLIEQGGVFKANWPRLEVLRNGGGT